MRSLRQMKPPSLPRHHHPLQPWLRIIRAPLRREDPAIFRWDFPYVRKGPLCACRYVRWTSPISYAVPALFWVRPRRSLLSSSKWTTEPCHGGKRGKLRPSPAITAHLREIVLRSGFVAGKELIRASPILKCVSPIDDLKHPCVVSKGVRIALKRAGRYQITI